MKHPLIVISVGVLLTGSLVASCKCNKDEEIPPMPSATAAPTTEPPLELVVEEDAGTDADADAGKKKHGYSVSKLVRCCRVLANNAKSAPPQQAPFMLQAAATCEAAARSGNYAAVNGALSRFGLSCR